MIAIAVTGGIACGKSLVARIFAKNGFQVLEADDLAHSLLEPGHSVYCRVVKCFGKAILDKDGRIDRRRLGKRVFVRPSDMARLNAIVHPAVRKGWQKWMTEIRKEGSNAAVVVPLLYEIGAAHEWDAVICVAASERMQIRRLRDRGLTAVEAIQRIKSQMPLARKVEMADYVIVNDGTEQAVEEQVARIIKDALEA